MRFMMKHGVALAAVVGGLSVIGSGTGCLTRDVVHSDPTTKQNFTTVVKQQSIDKVDLLFMIDNSASMGDKQALLAQAVPDMLNRLVSPNCVDMSGNPTGMHVAADGTTCPMGSKAEFPAVHDMHIGIVTSSLGGRGSDACDPSATNPANPALNAHNDDGGRLINRGGANETAVGDANPGGFLAWLPPVQANMGKMPGPDPSITMVGAPGMGGLIGDFTDMISGVHEHGCGFEAQNEAWYRFLVQPDPFMSVVKNNTTASVMGVDGTILQQRHDFLRPDSLLAVIVVTDENEEVADPLAIGGQAWAFANTAFPGSASGAAPKGSMECNNPVDSANANSTGPYDPACTSCYFLQGQPNFNSECPGGAYLDPTDDNLNVRFFHQMQRFGLFAGYPIDRYIYGLQKDHVPSISHSGTSKSADHEHDKNGNYLGDCTFSTDNAPKHNCTKNQKAPDGTAWADCVNPIYATNLPTDPGADLCNLTRGPRTPDLVYYAIIGGVPHQLLQVDPKSPDSPQKDTLSDSDWLAITGADPEHYDFTGADFHMLESETDRQGSQCPAASAADNCDPINGREWDTGKGDLQFACIFDIRPQYGGTGKDCGNMMYTGACDCGTNSQSRDTPLCSKGAGNNPDMKGYTDLQINGKAYPSVREAVIAHKMGTQGIISSLCPIHVTDNAGGTDPLYGYRPAVNAIVNRLKNSLNNQCLPERLAVDPSTTTVPCLILAQLPPMGATSCDAKFGLSNPDPAILAKFQAQQEAQWMASGGPMSGQPDPKTLTVCQVQQLDPKDFPNDFKGPMGACAPVDPGWCYVTGAAANGCPQAILFTQGTPPPGSNVSLECIEQAPALFGDGG